MRNANGYATLIGPNFRGGVQEHDVVTCIHCGAVSMTRSKISGQLEVLVYRPDGTHYLREAGFCRSCMAPTCPKAECNGPCTNRFRRLDEEEKLARKFLCL